MYSLRSDGAVVRDADRAVIPNDPTNTDRQAYQAWLAAGNSPTPAPPGLASPTVPSEVTNYQARAILIQRGLFAKVDAALRNADQNQAANALAFAAWEHAGVFERASPLIAAMGAALGLVSADIDALFIAAAQVT